MGVKLKFLMTALPYHANTEALFPDSERAFINSMVARGQAVIVGNEEHPLDKGTNEEARLSGVEEMEVQDDQRRGGLAGSFQPAVKSEEEAQATAEAGKAQEAHKGEGGPAVAGMGGGGGAHSATANTTAPATRTGASASVKK